jgi:hypothetical protein
MDKEKTVETDEKGTMFSFNFVLQKHFCFVNRGGNSLFM